MANTTHVPIDVDAVKLAVTSYGYAHVPRVFDPEEVRRIAAWYEAAFLEALEAGNVAVRDPGRFCFKFPPNDELGELLCNEALGRIVQAVLGEGAELTHITSHTALPKSGAQAIHHDGCHSINGSRAVAAHESSVYVHIPLVPIDEEMGPTELWPALFQNHQASLIEVIKERIWVEQNLEADQAVAAPGDVILKNHSNFHRGSSNRSTSVRPMITLIYSARHFNQRNSDGRIPCGTYDVKSSIPIRTSVARDRAKGPREAHPVELVGTHRIPPDVLSRMPYHLKHEQYLAVPDYLTNEGADELQEGISKGDTLSVSLGLAERLYRLMRRAYSGRGFYLHSVAVHNASTSDEDDEEYECNFDGTEIGGGGGMVPTRPTVIQACVALERSDRWLNVLPGNALLSHNLSKGGDRAFAAARKRTLPAKMGSLLLRTGTLYCSRSLGARTLVLTFVEGEYFLGGDEMIVVTDEAARKFSPELRSMFDYSQIYITQPENLSFINLAVPRWNYRLRWRLLTSVMRLARHFEDPIEGRLFRLLAISLAMMFVPPMLIGRKANRKALRSFDHGIRHT